MKKYLTAAALLIASLASAQAPPDDYFAVGAGIGNSFGWLGGKVQKSVPTGNTPSAASFGLGVIPTDNEALLAYSFNYKFYPFKTARIIYFKAGFETTRYTYDVVDGRYVGTYKTNYDTDENLSLGAGIDWWMGDHIALNAGTGASIEGDLLIDLGLLVSW